MVMLSHLRSLQAVELAVRTGSFTEAGALLGITPAAVGQRVKALEDYLGVRLLDRRRAGVAATPELAAALPHLARAFADLDAAAAQLDLQRGRELHIAAPPDFTDLWLAPRLERFHAAHPAIRLCLNGEGDAPARIGRPDCEIVEAADAGDDHADLLFRDRIAPLGSPANCARVAGIAEAQRLEGFPLLHVDGEDGGAAAPGWPRWFAVNSVARTAPERGVRFRRVTAALDAMLADAGFALCGMALLRAPLDAGRIALPYPAATGWESAHAYVARYRTDWADKRHVRRFRDWLAAEAAQTRDWLASHAAGAEN